MSKLSSLLFLMGLLCFQPGLALAGETVAPPKTVQTKGLDGFRYWFVKHAVTDVDEVLQKQGIDSAVCTFRQMNPKQDFSYRETGKCLMKSFLKSMESDEYAGTIYVWIRDAQGRFHSAEIRWRPPRGGWGSIINQFFELKFESSLHWVRHTFFGKESAEKVRFQEFLFGDLEIILPEDPAALKTLADRGNVWVQKYLTQLKSISLSLKTTERPEGKMVHAGTIVMQLKSTETRTETQMKISLRTNMNIIVKKRPFFIQAKTEMQGTEWLQPGSLQ